MRKIFSKTIENLAVADERIIFISGDLGFNAFENLQKSLGERFINAGVAEQNMISMAAGLAYKGYKVFCYSIAPFIVYRCLEQFRNDVCFHNLPVFIVGNGGGYGYGIMGSSHHAIEDIACLGGLPNNQCFVPAFNNDVAPILKNIVDRAQPAYLRLGLGSENSVELNLPGFFTKRIKAKTLSGTVIALGPVVTNVLNALSQTTLKDKFDLFTVHKTPFALNKQVLASIKKSKRVLVIEEHVSEGGVGEKIALQLLEKNISLHKFVALCAKGYPTGQYGNQDFHQRQSGLHSENISKVLRKFLN